MTAEQTEPNGKLQGEPFACSEPNGKLQGEDHTCSELNGKLQGEDHTCSDEDNSEGAQLEKLISSLGQFGRYQQYVFFLTCIGSFMPAMVVVAMPFLAYEPLHRCQVMACEADLEAARYNTSFLNFTTPYDIKQDRWQQCEQNIFGRALSEDVSESSCVPQYFSNETQACQSGHVFDDSLFQSSIITDFDLWCSSPLYRSLAGMVYMIGMLLGAITLGDLADRIGRRNGLVVSCSILGVCGIASAAAPNYPMFLVARLFTGAGAVGLFQITFVLAVEFIGTKYRTFVGIMIETPFALGEAMTGVFAYFIRDWRYLQLAVTVPSLLLISYRWIMPESVRWLVSQNRTEEAIETLRKMAKTNKKELPEESMDFIRNRCKKQIAVKYSTEADIKVEATNGNVVSATTIEETKEKKKTVFDLLRTPRMRARSLNLFFAWAVVTFMYYGLSLNSGNIGGNVFLSFILTMLIEIPSYLFSWWALDVMGRKGTLMFMCILGGVSCIIAGTMPSGYSSSVVFMSLLGKFGASAGFAIVYVYSCEIFPTDYRGVGVGSCSMFARVGGMLAPLIVEIFRKVPAVSPIIFGILGCICGILVMFLPETVGARLPQTLEESENFGSNQRTADCCFFLARRRQRKIDINSA